MDETVQPRGDQRISAVLWRGKHLIAIATIVAITLAIILTLHSKKVYEASGVIQISIPSQIITPDTTTANQALAQNYATLFTSAGMLRKIRPQVEGGRLSTAALSSRLSASAVEQSALVKIHATGPSPASAQRLGSQAAEAFLKELQNEASSQTARQQSQIQATITSLSARIASLERSPTATEASTAAQIRSLQASRQALITQSASLVANALARGSSATLSAPPVASSSPISPRTLLNLIGGVLIGLVIGVGLALLYDRLQPWLRSADDAAAALDAPLLASIPLRARLRDRDPILQESYEVLRANLFLAMNEVAKPLVTVIGPNPKVGKTATVEGLGRVAARAGRKVLVVDGDMRAGTLSSRLAGGTLSSDLARSGRSQGLSDILEGRGDFEQAQIEIASRLWLLPTKRAPTNPSSLLSGGNMRALLTDLREAFDLVLFDSPPLVGIADGLLLASESDTVIVVARTGLTKGTDLQSVKTSMQQSQTPIAGLVIFEERQVSEYYYPASDGPSVQRDPAMSP